MSEKERSYQTWTDAEQVAFSLINEDAQKAYSVLRTAFALFQSDLQAGEAPKSKAVSFNANLSGIAGYINNEAGQEVIPQEQILAYNEASYKGMLSLSEEEKLELRQPPNFYAHAYANALIESNLFEDAKNLIEEWIEEGIEEELDDVQVGFRVLGAEIEARQSNFDEVMRILDSIVPADPNGQIYIASMAIEFADRHGMPAENVMKYILNNNIEPLLNEEFGTEITDKNKQLISQFISNYTPE